MAPWRAKLQATLALGIGLASLGAGLGGVYLEVQFAAEQRALHAAALCSAPQPAATSAGCTYTGPATITAIHRVVRIYVDLTFAAMPSRTFTTSFATTREPAPGVVRIGATQTAQLWDGKVTRVAGTITVDNPDSQPSNQIPAALVFVAAGLGTSIWSGLLVRRAWSR